MNAWWTWPRRTKEATDQRADFIAAARRAVQAAALEAADQGKEPASRERPPGAFSKISQAIRNRKRTLLLAATVVVLAIGAIRIFGGLTASIMGRLLTATAEPDAVEAPAPASDPAPRDVMAMPPLPPCRRSRR